MKRTLWVLVATGALVALAQPPAPRVWAQSRPADPGPTASAAGLGEDSPRGAMRAFLAAARRGDYAAAAVHLNLSGLPAAAREAEGARRARQLHVVLERTLWCDPDSLSDQPEGIEDDGLPPGRDLLGAVRVRGGTADLLLARARDAEGRWTWRVSAATVGHVPELYAEHGYPAFVDRLPRVLVAWRVFDTDLWQWLGLAALALCAWALAFVVARVLRRLVLFLVRRTETEIDNQVADALHRPLRLVVTLYLFLAGSYWLRLALPLQKGVVSGVHAATVVLLTWMLLRIVDILTRATQARMLREERRGAVSMLTLGRRAAKVVIVALGVLGLLQNLGYNVTGIVAGLGIGGLAVALGAQKTLENVFGGVALTVDRPIRVGDFCRFGDKTGTVEDVGLRSTRVRTLDGTVISVPNAELAAIEIENFTVRNRFRLHTVFGVRYETTPDQIRWLVERVRAALAAHPLVTPDPLRVRFVGFGASSLDIEVFTFVATEDIDEFYAVREGLFLRIMDLVAEAGTSFAFPSQTLYLGRDAAPDPERAAALAREAAARRPPAAGA